MRESSASVRHFTSSGVRRLVIAGLVLFAATGCGFFDSTVTGSGTLTTENYPVDSFDRVEVEDDVHINLFITPDAAPSVDATTDDNLHEHLSIRAADGTLTIGTIDGVAIEPSMLIDIAVAGSELQGLAVTEDAAITATVPAVDELELRFDDDGALNLVIDTERLVATGDSDGRLSTTGRAETVEVNVDNDAKAVLLGTEIATATVAASSDAEITLEALDSVTGSADNDAVVRVGGAATVDVATSSDAVVTGLE